ncbi:hypothetical protein [Actinomadura atramentaria]|uniref:hypothetical protein n=1 Tax=Actinomadura atramentaria TaxID=1990 RepID=UPI00037B1FAD|nr:hypothetical protein [Actinomadura atramentaria]
MARQEDEPEYVNDGILDPAQTLDGAPTEDPLDEGITVPEHWSTVERFGATAEEQQQGETLDQRFWQEEPDAVQDTDASEVGEWVSDTEAKPGRVVPADDGDGELLGREVPSVRGFGPEDDAMIVTDEDADRAAVPEDPPDESLAQAEAAQQREMERDAASDSDPNVSG